MGRGARDDWSALSGAFLVHCNKNVTLVSVKLYIHGVYELLRTIESHAKEGQHVVENAPQPSTAGHQTDAQWGHRPAEGTCHGDVLVYADK